MKEFYKLPLKSTQPANIVEKHSVISVFSLPMKANAPNMKSTFSKITYTIDNAGNVKQSLRRFKDAIIWPVSVETSFATYVEEFGEAVDINVLPNHQTLDSHNAVAAWITVFVDLSWKLLSRSLFASLCLSCIYSYSFLNISC